MAVVEFSEGRQVGGGRHPVQPGRQERVATGEGTQQRYAGNSRKQEQVAVVEVGWWGRGCGRCRQAVAGRRL